VTLLRGSRYRRGLIFLTVAALAVAWLLPGKRVPIYDGVGAPDEPYRYVSVPTGVQIRTQPPTAATVTVQVSNGNASQVVLATLEQGPQAEADIVDQSSLTVPASADSGATPESVTVTLTPLAPTPADPHIDGNIYRLRWAAGSAIPKFDNHGGDLMYMRATVAPPPQAVFLYRPAPGAPWRRLVTERAGTDVYATLLQGAGDYALTRQPFPGSAAGTEQHAASGGTVPWSVILIAILVLGTVAAVLIIRRHRLRSTQ
jgi:hypothetical protein